ncbi:MAG: discoidin domain-containing protein, partial [Muribaculaceae bacterium]|nr:discoidin domain-containing protein [Muribaculaceae bacterium]
DIYRHEGLTNGNWYDVEVDEDGSWRYARYIGPYGSHCNVNEVEFFAPDGRKLTGEVIGTEGIAGKTREKVFDGDILTGFEGVSPDGHWIGLKFQKPERISRIRYIPRNDGNCIEVGDCYELFYWHDNDWQSMGDQTATSNYLNYSDVPSGGLYVVRNLTKGQEERIFTYEDGQQIWW